MNIDKLPNGAKLSFDKGTNNSYSGTDLLEISARLKAFVTQNADTFEERPTKKVQFRGTEFKVSVTDKLWFWEELESGKWESPTFDVFDKYLDQDTVFLDVGGWIGSTFLYAVQKVKHGTVFEPDPSAFKELQSNIGLNKTSIWHSRCEAVRSAIAPESGKVKLGFRNTSGDSMSSVLLSGSDNGEEVKAISLSEFVRSRKLENEKLFVKMDVEGFEYDILPSLKDFIQQLPNATFHISLHPQFLLDKLAEEKTGGNFRVSVIRKQFYEKHQALLRSFKGYQCTFINGKSFNSRKELTKALITGQFSRDLIFFR